MSSTAHSDMRPIFTGGGKSPVAIRAYQVDRETGIGPDGAMICLRRKNPARRGSFVFSIGCSFLPTRIPERAYLVAELVENKDEFMINSAA